jgi:hypothetical protein
MSKSEQVVIDILNRCNNKQTLETQLFIGSESVKQYGKDLLYYIAEQVAPEKKEEILGIELS